MVLGNITIGEIIFLLESLTGEKKVMYASSLPVSKCLRGDCGLHRVGSGKGEKYAPDPDGIRYLGHCRRFWDIVLMAACFPCGIKGPPERAEERLVFTRRRVQDA